eukprot:scaffold60173_cov49-Attheya_sp.AAC.1
MSDRSSIRSSGHLSCAGYSGGVSSSLNSHYPHMNRSMESSSSSYQEQEQYHLPPQHPAVAHYYLGPSSTHDPYAPGGHYPNHFKFLPFRTLKDPSQTEFPPPLDSIFQDFPAGGWWTFCG